MLLGTLIVGGTLAYLTASKDKINTITVGKVEVVIEEPGVNNNSVEWGINSKPVYLTATNDSIDGVVRAMIIPEFLNENGEYINCPGAAQNAPVSNKIVMGDITLVFASDWADHWFYKDGFFYYKTVLPAGEATTKLLSGVVLTNDTAEMREKYQSITVEIEVLADIIQPNADAVAMWGAKLNGGIIEP